MEIRIESVHSAYYDSLPSIQHCTGDIWRNLPSFGLTSGDHCPGLVISPSCDLYNGKTCTVNYLPIVPVNEFLCCSDFYAEARGALLQILRGLNHGNGEALLPTDRLPSQYDTSSLHSFLSEKRGASAVKDRERQNGKAILALITLMIAEHGRSSLTTQECLRGFAKKNRNRIVEGIVNNTFRSDVHFLPKEQSDPDWIAIEEHSLVLLRKPFSIPIDVLDAASNSAPERWNSDIRLLSHNSRYLANFSGEYPMKCLRLKEAFLKDLLGRFLGLFLRMGSPNFSEYASVSIQNELGAGE